MSLDFTIYQNIIISILGICILIPLSIAVFFESKKEYSRKIYIKMLVACAGILIIESLQWLFDGKSSGAEVYVFMSFECLFYILLCLLCRCWTLYSYYWFNGYPPSKKTEVCFSAGTAVEIFALFINIFSGSIYRIDFVSGTYSRGPLFPFFIGFCYCYLIAAIIITSVLAAIRNPKKHKNDFLLFLLFFIFPIIGPLLQYIFPLISIMGISEAVALLTVYVAVQQRINADYAVEKAKYREEMLKYEKTLEKILSASADALGIFHLNLTKNTRNDTQGTSAYIRNLIHGTTVDETFDSIAKVVTDKNDAVEFRKVFNRKKLLQNFTEDNSSVSLEFHRLTDSGESHLIKAFLNMIRNPATGDIEAIAYSIDIDKQEKEEKVISAITNREYDYIVLIDVKTRKIHYQYLSNKIGNSVMLAMGDYDEVMAAAIAAMNEINKKNIIMQSITFNTVYEALKNQNEYYYVFTFENKNGEKFQKRITYQYLDERKTEILFFRSDITEEMRIEREHTEKLSAALQNAQHANAMKSEFLSNVSHDVRTPLNAVLGYTELAKKAETLDEVKPYLEKLDRAGNIILSLVNDTLDLSKIESGAITLKPSPVSCSEILKKIVASIQPSIDEKHITFILDNSRAVMATVNVDILRLQEIFTNLLSNAVKFTPEKGTIKLTVECTKLEPHCVHDRISVKDTGCGMSKEFLPKAFEPFAQERQPSTAGVSGSGLGLSIVKKLVELMGGTISVVSELGKGSEFTVELVLERVEDIPDEKNQPEPSFDMLNGKNVLLTEDNEMNMEIASAVLAMKGINVTCAENGKIACEKFAQSNLGDFDAILMDIRMPVMDGLEAACTIRKMERADAASIPIIAMSANAFDDDIKTSLRAGMNAHIAKPVNPQKLYKLLADNIKIK